MATIKGLTIEIAGETTKLDRAMSGVNKQSRDLQSELKQIEKLLKLDPTNTDLLAQRQTVLAATIATTTQKEQMLKDAEKQVQQQFAEGKVSEEQLRAIQREVIKAGQDTEKFGSQADGAMEKAKSGTATLDGAVKGLASTLGVNIPPALDGMVSRLGNVSTAGAALVGGLAAVGAALGKATLDTAKLADDILTQSSITGLATDSLQELNYASELLDVSTETTTGSMTKMIKSMTGAREGSKLQADAYKKLGIAVTGSNGELRDANEVFYEAIDALGKMKNETERDALSMQIFGKSARELNPLIEAGGGALKQFAAEAHNVGYVIDADSLNKFGQLDDAMQRLSKKGDALKNSFAEALLPMLTSFFEVVSAIPTPVLQMLVVLAGVIATIIMVVKAIQQLQAAGGFLMELMSKTWDTKMIKTTAIIAGVVVVLLALAAAIAVVMGKGQQIENAMTSIGNSVGSMNKQISDTQNGRRIPQYADGTMYHPGGYAIVGERGPELVDLPQGSKVYPNGSILPNQTINVTVQSSDLQDAARVVRLFEGFRQAYNAN